MASYFFSTAWSRRDIYQWPVFLHQLPFVELHPCFRCVVEKCGETEVWPCWSLAEAMICCHQIMNASWPMGWRCGKKICCQTPWCFLFDHPEREFPVKTTGNNVWDAILIALIAFGFGGIWLLVTDQINDGNRFCHGELFFHIFGVKSQLTNIFERGWNHQPD